MVVCSFPWFCCLQEKAAQKAKEARAKAELDAARRVAEEMGMGSVGKADGIRLAAHRIKRKVAGTKVRHKYLGSSSSLSIRWTSSFWVQGLGFRAWWDGCGWKPADPPTD